MVDVNLTTTFIDPIDIFKNHIPCFVLLVHRTRCLPSGRTQIKNATVSHVLGKRNRL